MEHRKLIKHNTDVHIYLTLLQKFHGKSQSTAYNFLLSLSRFPLQAGRSIYAALLGTQLLQ